MTTEKKAPSTAVDWKKMNPSDFLRMIFENKAILFQLVVVGVGIFFLMGLWERFAQNKNYTTDLITAARNKIGFIDTWDAVDKQYQQYLKSAPVALDADNLVGYLSDLASTHQMDIVSFSPGVEKEQEYYQTTVIEIVCQVNAFKDLVLFLKDIEKNEFPLRVYSLNISLRGENGLTARLSVMAVKMKVKQ